MILSVDINQAYAQFGLVSPDGRISHTKKFETRDWVASAGVLHYLKKEINKYIHAFPAIGQVGIGLPGILSANKKEIIHAPHMADLDHVSIADNLSDEFPELEMKFERSATCMALGELYYGKYGVDSFLLISLDACIESSVIIDGKVFSGVKGNGGNISHIVMNGEKSFEREINWYHLEEYIYRQLDQEVTEYSALHGKGLTPELVFATALKGDRIARSMFIHVGQLVGNVLVAVLPILDVSTVLLTGRLALASDLLIPSIYEQLNIHLPTYYTQYLSLTKAVVGEKAGLLGAACLFLHPH